MSKCDKKAQLILCPICQQRSAVSFHPFCSLRCANVDLSRWFSGRYCIPGRTASSVEQQKENDVNSL